MTNDIGPVWVLVETSHRKALDSCLELISAAHRVAGISGRVTTAVVLGFDIQNAVNEAFMCGADSVIAVDDKKLEVFNTETYRYVLLQLYGKYTPDTIILSATENGKQLAPRISARLNTGLTANCTGFESYNENGVIRWTRPTYGGRLYAEIICPKSRPQMGTIRPGIYTKSHVPSPKNIVINESISIPKIVQASEMSSHSLNENPFEFGDSEVIVSGGLGLGKAGGFRLISDFAEILGGKVGASRAAVNKGWISSVHQVGQSGNTVKPKVYIACGISGAVQHIAGISPRSRIIAINSDASAPIFQYADYGFVGDLYEIIPRIMDKISQKI